MSGFLGAVSFLTRVPVGRHPEGAGDLARSVPWFPVVGFAVGLVAAGVYAAALPLLTPLVAATLAVAAPFVVTGGFHEDGLADLADAAGGWSREDRLRILDDPRHGTFGVLAIAVTLLLRVSAVSALDAWAALAALPAAHAAGRGAAVGLMGAVGPASVQGAGASYARDLRPAQVRAGVGTAVVLTAVALGGWALAAVALGGAAAAAVGAYARRTLGGVNGDVLGATQQVTEVLVLLLAVAVGATHLPFWRP